MSERDQRTEQPTQQRVRKAREEGRFPVSREFVASVQFFIFALLTVGLAHIWWPGALAMFNRLLRFAFHSGDLATTMPLLLRESVLTAPLPLLLAGGVVFLGGLFAQLASTEFGFAPGSLSLDLSKLNPAPRMSGLWKQNRRAFVEASVLLLCVGLMLFMLAVTQLESQLRLGLLPLREAVAEEGRLLGSLLWKGAMFLLIWGAIDLVRTRRRYTSELKMTKHEIREEHKQSEGSPEIKMRVRRLRREMLRRRMMAQVAEATAVVTNPTHYAVALKYDLGSMSTPQVVAKGKNYLAMRIRQRAAEHQVPIVENPPLARALYKSVDVGSEIPAHLYRAVAEVLAYVYRMLGKAPNSGKEGNR